ncbi:single-stranded DNA-binding protein [Anaerolineales bacterium HSG25]|nr:single-stranded DNA-binding protein [Anaerolineales bacterium HSG25]
MHQNLQLIGNLGRDPEMRYTPSGQAVTDFSMATSNRWTGRDGQQQSETTWFRITAWGKLAEICNQYLSKGRQVFVEGRLASEIKIWTDQGGNPRASYEVTANTIRFLGNRSDSQPQQGGGYQQRSGGGYQQQGGGQQQGGYQQQGGGQQQGGYQQQSGGQQQQEGDYQQQQPAPAPQPAYQPAPAPGPAPAPPPAYDDGGIGEDEIPF